MNLKIQRHPFHPISMVALKDPVASEGKDELALSLASLADAFNRLAVAVEGMLLLI